MGFYFYQYASLCQYVKFLDSINFEFRQRIWNPKILKYTCKSKLERILRLKNC